MDLITVSIGQSTKSKSLVKRAHPQMHSHFLSSFSSTDAFSKAFVFIRSEHKLISVSCLQDGRTHESAALRALLLHNLLICRKLSQLKDGLCRPSPPKVRDEFRHASFSSVSACACVHSRLHHKLGDVLC